MKWKSTISLVQFCNELDLILDPDSGSLILTLDPEELVLILDPEEARNDHLSRSVFTTIENRICFSLSLKPALQRAQSPAKEPWGGKHQQ